MTNIHILPIPALRDNYIWAIIDDKTQSAVIVDPGEAAPVKDFLAKNNLTLKAILITHHHWDHTNGIQGLIQNKNMPIYGSNTHKVTAINHPIKDGDTFKIAGFQGQFKAIAIPGHTLDHMAYYFDNNLFCGDTLFSAGCGRLFEGTAEQMYHSLQKIMALPDDTYIYCAHEYTLNNLRFAQLVEPQNQLIIERLKIINEIRKNNLPTLPSTLKIEKATNPFLRVTIAAVKKFAEDKTQQQLQDPVEIFKIIRQCKDHF